MQEKIYNLFLFITDGVIYELGALYHKRSGTDDEKLAFLQSQVEYDFLKAKRYSVPKRYLITDGTKGVPGTITYQTYLTMSPMDIFEEVFETLKAPQNPLMCVSPIVDGKLEIMGTTSI